MNEIPLGRHKTADENNAGQTSPQTSQVSKIQWKLSDPRYDMQDIILAPDTLREFEDVISYVQNRNKLFNEWGLAERYRDRDSLAVNLYGEPGTGKTMAAHAISKELGLKMICVDYADIESKYVEFYRKRGNGGLERLSKFHKN